MLGATRLTLVPAGTWCPACGRLRGGDRGYAKKTYEATDLPARALPPELATVLRGGEATLRFPASVKLAGVAEDCARRGEVNAEFAMHHKSRRWAVTRLHAPGHANDKSALANLREEILRVVPDAATWVSRATANDLRLALAVTAVPKWRTRNWPGRVWTAYLATNSKEGDAGRIVESLGARVPRRDYALWFYGQGTIDTDKGPVHIRGETCLTNSQLGNISSVVAKHVRLIENRDLASIHEDGLILAVDGNPKEAHLELLRTASRLEIPTRAWFDMDAEGVRMARTVANIPTVVVEGFAAYPAAWGISIHDDAEKLRNLRLEEMTPGPFGEVLQHIRANEVFWEQERIFAEGDVQGQSLSELARRFPFSPKPAKPS